MRKKHIIGERGNPKSSLIPNRHEATCDRHGEPFAFGPMIAELCDEPIHLVLERLAALLLGVHSDIAPGVSTCPRLRTSSSPAYLQKLGMSA